MKRFFSALHLLNKKQLDHVFDEGQTLDFKCTVCGSCCKGEGDVFFTEEELTEIEKFLSITDKKQKTFREKFIHYTQNGLHVHASEKECFFLKNNRCEIYKVRPLQCRTYPFWTSLYRSKQSLLQLEQHCPGAMKGTGRVFSRETIIRRSNATLRKFVDKQSDPCNYIPL